MRRAIVHICLFVIASGFAVSSVAAEESAAAIEESHVASEEGATAEEADGAPAREDKAAGEEKFPLQIAAGIKGGVAGVAGYGFDNPSTFLLDNGAASVSPEFYGHFGTGGLGGLSLEVRILHFLGLEFGLYYGQTTAKGYVDKNDALTGRTLTRLTSETVTKGLQIPILLKFNVPGPTVRPFLGLGVEFVRQSDSEITYGQEPRAGVMPESEMNKIRRQNSVRPVNYPLFAFNLGVEVVAGPVRIPIEIRGGYALGYSRDINQRAEYLGREGSEHRIAYDTMYMGHFSIFTGVLYEFDLLL